MRAVDSRNSVSFGGILWKTTLEIDDFPLLFRVSTTVVKSGEFRIPSLTHQQQSRLAFRSRTGSWSGSLRSIFLLHIEAILFIDTFKIQLGWTNVTDRPLTRRTVIFSIQLSSTPSCVEKGHAESSMDRLKCMTRRVMCWTQLCVTRARRS
jgi:hypothetical protein